MIEPKTMPNPYRKIEIGDLVLWSRPWSDGRALVTANEGGTNIFLYDFAKKHPDSCWLLEDEDEFTRNQVTDGAFSIVVDPKRFRISVSSLSSNAASALPCGSGRHASSSSSIATVSTFRFSAA